MSLVIKVYAKSIKIFCDKIKREITYCFRVYKYKDGAYELGYQRGCEVVLTRQCICEPEMKEKIKNNVQNYYKNNYA